MIMKKPEYNWMPGPSYLCRRRLVLKLLGDIKPGSVLEIGFGSGDLLEILNQKGYKGVGIDFSGDACRALLARHQGEKLNFRIMAQAETELAEWLEKFDIIMAFEVLEHIENDLEALLRWHNLAADGGHLLLSVPAHARKYDAEDHVAGHARRYEKQELINKLSVTGFTVLKFYSYGYPLINLSKKVRSYFAAKSATRQTTMEQRSREIGKGLIFWRPGKYLFNDFTLWPAYLLQSLFLDSDLGDGYLVLARKTNPGAAVINTNHA